MWNSPCLMIVVLVAAPWQPATALVQSDDNGNPDARSRSAFASHVDLWRDVGYTDDESTVTSGLTTDDPGKGCLPCACGAPGKRLGIVGGNSTYPNEYPWMALIRWNHIFICGGSLINDRYVLTAAHCVLEGGRLLDPRDLIVELLRYDMTSRYDEHVEFNVSKIIHHYEYDSIRSIYELDYDIALLLLDTEGLDIGPKSKIHPVCLPIKDDDFVGDLGTVSGWGSTGENGDESNVLHDVIVPIISNEECRVLYREEYINKESISDNMMCAGYMEGKKDSCQGDSGGPLLIKNNLTYHIVGIVSWGIGCAEPRIPGVYTRVNRFLDWLTDETEDACYCSVP